MPTIKLTKRVIDELQADPKDVFYWDTDITGLAVKVTPKNKKTFVVQYRVGGRGTPTRKMSLGSYGSVTLHQARLEEKKYLACGRTVVILHWNGSKKNVAPCPTASPMLPRNSWPNMPHRTEPWRRPHG